MENYFIYNPIQNKYPHGAVKIGQSIRYTVKVAGIVDVKDIYFVYTQDATNNQTTLTMQRSTYKDGYFDYYVDVDFSEIGHYWYHFRVVTPQEEFFLEKTPTFTAQKSYILHSQYMQLIYEKPATCNRDYQSGVMYHIFVDRFCSVGKVTPKLCPEHPHLSANLRKDWGGEVDAYIDDEKINNNEFFGGNLQGIISKLDYLKSLNVTTLYLSPIFESRSNHKYDTADYSKIDSMFGTMQDFQELINKAKEKGIGIILDGVFNHTGSDSIYFNRLGTYDTIGAYQSKDSPYYNWYKFTDHPDKYECWWGISILPHLNDADPGFIEYMTGRNGILINYMRMGLVGFRLDVVDELSSTFLDQLCRSIRRVKKGGLIIGEVWEDASNKIAYGERRKYFLGNQLDSVMNYPLKNSIIDYVKTGNVESLLACVYMLKDHYPTSVQNNLMNILGTHDTARILTVLGLDQTDNSSGYRKNNIYLTKPQLEKAINLLKQASLLQYTLMGVPCIYYGDEAGVQGIGDPYNRSCYPWGKENPTLIDWYSTLGILRQNPVFIDGETNILHADNGVFVYERRKGEKRIVIAINKSSEPFELKLNEPHNDYLNVKRLSEVVVNSDDMVILVK